MSQATYTKSIEAKDIRSVEITFECISNVTIMTTDEHTIRIEAISEGEFENKLLITSEAFDSKFVISDRFQPFSQYFGDKLSAHKIFMASVNIYLPEYLDVDLRAGIATISIKGKYKNILAELNTGNCTLSSFSGRAIVNTVDGDIKVFLNNIHEPKYLTSDKHTKEYTLGNTYFKLKTISGNINLCKIK